MYKRRVLFGILKIVCAMLLLGAMLVGYRSWQRHSGQQSRHQDAFSMELRALTLRQRELELQLQALEKEYTRIVAGQATVQILAADPGEWVEESLHPAMTEADMTGIIAMNLDAIPGGVDTLSPSQLHKLEAEGWQLIYAFDEFDFDVREKEIQKKIKKWQNYQKWKTGKEPPEKDRSEMEQELLREAFQAWKQEVQDGLRELGIELDNVIYFPSGAYKRIYDNALRGAGFDMIIHHGEEDRIIYASLPENSIWFPGALPWNVSKRIMQMDEVVELGVNVVLTVSHPESTEQDQYVSEFFTSMLRKLNAYREDGTMEVCTFRDMADFQSKSVADKNAKEYERQKQAVQAELDEVNEQIQAVYAKYGMG